MQLCGALNDEFDPGLRRIEIEDSDSVGNREAAAVWLRDMDGWVMVPREARGAGEHTPGGIQRHERL
ncbi:hypothetical protein EZ315_09855 [Duncaniella freteri]|uniref:Uncharacterized protein n=1 Tax=Duncaniella freteri TaxID=2530391 RepID=A0A4Z0VCK3_9BACT|nr:hypothetical protein [Duncaniella freteri]TGG40952.1 hypothetical protein EZ315_09855 [Duncaniella freteri]